ncbi:MAG: hypothetical protein ACI3U8_02185 [Candidatus Onthomonas sp.]
MVYEDEKALREALEEAEQQRYRAVCKVRCLESSLDRIEYERFDEIMSKLEEARAEVRQAGYRCMGLRWQEANASFAKFKDSTGTERGASHE